MTPAEAIDTIEKFVSRMGNTGTPSASSDDQAEAREALKVLSLLLPVDVKIVNLTKDF